MSPLDDFEEVMACHQSWLLGYVRRSVRDDDLAASIVQDTFMRAYLARASFRGECAIRSWLVAIALNLIRDEMRSKQHRFWRDVAQSAEDTSEIERIVPEQRCSPELLCIQQEQLRSVYNAMQRLSVEQLLIIQMRMQEERSLSEIAGVLQKPVNTVKSTLHRSLRVLRHALGVSDVRSTVRLLSRSSI